MSMPTREELLLRFGKVEDPEIEARRQHIIEVLLEASPKTRRQLIEKGLLDERLEDRFQGRLEGRLAEARTGVLRVLARRQLIPRKEDDARIEACTNLPTLRCWLERAVTATSASDALE